MPELPEVETVRKGLLAALEGARLVAVRAGKKPLRRPLPRDLAKRLTGRRILAIGRRAKYLLWRLDDGNVVLLHLGMSGRIKISEGGGAAGKHDHVVFETDKGLRIAFTDPRRFGLLLLVHETELAGHPLLKDLGPEPLEENFGAELLADRLKGKSTSIKAALLDQRLVAGLGNIYVSEALFYAGISPKRLAKNVRRGEIGKLVTAIKSVLTKAIAAGGSTLRDHIQPDGQLGYFQHSFAVYDREGRPCPGCDCDIKRTGGVRRIVQGGRSSFYCARRQS